MEFGHVSSSAFVFNLCVAFFFFVFSSSRARTTDPSEVRALNSIFAQWNIKADTRKWNTTGDPCSGAALDSTNYNFNPLIKCNCSFNSSSVCHITILKVSALGVTGQIPEEMWSLRFLSNLNLAQNYLTGSLSPAIGNLIRMEYLTVGMNALSGRLPKEVGELTELLTLAFNNNNFSGEPPSELGSLTNLQQLNMDSCGLSGEIPSTFASLQNLQRLWASDVAFTGKIPDFIGNWPHLMELRFHGNSFDGPIPSSFANLNSLEELRLSDISNGGTSLDFIKDMVSLHTLVLRNNDITGSIPPTMERYRFLEHLDLSFNKLSGQIPDSLFGLRSLDRLFLGNNSLSGTLPQEKKASLRTIDLSYNNLNGDLPPWVEERDLQLNLVGNKFFKVKTSRNGALPPGLNCLQQDFPCNRGKGVYYNFGINCGGPKIRPSNSIVYERDDETLGQAMYYVDTSQRWAVSNAGIFSEKIISSLTSGQAIIDSSRVSSSSLRYYGLGLENGNYNISLQFAEMALLDDASWISSGRRVFDVYIQGILVLKDFDMRKEAGGLYPRSTEQRFTARVFETTLKSIYFGPEKGLVVYLYKALTGLRSQPSVPSQVRYDLNDFKPTVSNISPAIKEKNETNMIIIGSTASVGFISLFLFFGFFYLRYRRRRKAQMLINEELLGIDMKLFTFSYAQLKSATNDFDSANKVGEGGFGLVYKGTLNDGRAVAIKQLSVTTPHRRNQFVAEIATISAVQHRNLVKLYGCCIEGDKRLLVLEYLENKSLDQALFGNSSLNLNWPMRFNICLGVARGLAYLHEESHIRIVHRDVKASNILLDSSLNPKISDFGLAKFYDYEKTHISTGVAGTFGYLAPEYAMSGHLTEKADVYAFGVVALETVSGRPRFDLNLEEQQRYLLDWAWTVREQNREDELVDPRMQEFDKQEVKRVIGVALLCSQMSPVHRPSMSRAVAMLAGDMEVIKETPKPGYFPYRGSSSLTSGSASEATGSSTYSLNQGRA